MPSTDIAALKAEITEKEIAQMARIEGLINIRTSLEEDRIEAAENLAQIFENREEEILALRLDFRPVAVGIRILNEAYLELKEQAKKAQFDAIKEA